MAKTISARKKKELVARVLEVQKAQPIPLGTRRSAMIPQPIPEEIVVQIPQPAKVVVTTPVGYSFPKGFNHNIPGLNKKF